MSFFEIIVLHVLNVRTMGLLFHASELNLPDECIFGLAAWHRACVLSTFSIVGCVQQWYGMLLICTWCDNNTGMVHFILQLIVW